jgi:uncharacterized protein YdaU (DUF1376 family)
MANNIRWYKRDPNAALEGMAVLNLEERGAYNTIIDLIYSHDGKIDDDDRFIAGWLRVDVRVWKRIRRRLLDLGKLYVYAGTLRNERADREVHEATRRIAIAAQAGLASACKREAVRKIINSLTATPVERTSQPPTPTPTNIISCFTQSGAPEPLAELPPVQTTRRISELSRTELETCYERKRVQASQRAKPTARGPSKVF